MMWVTLPAIFSPLIFRCRSEYVNNYLKRVSNLRKSSIMNSDIVQVSKCALSPSISLSDCGYFQYISGIIALKAYSNKVISCLICVLKT